MTKRPPSQQFEFHLGGRPGPASAGHTAPARRTVVGPGGLGKTRLAHAVSRRAEQRVVYFVPLAGVTATRTWPGGGLRARRGRGPTRRRERPRLGRPGVRHPRRARLRARPAGAGQLRARHPRRRRAGAGAGVDAGTCGCSPPAVRRSACRRSRCTRCRSWTCRPRSSCSRSGPGPPGPAWSCRRRRGRAVPPPRRAAARRGAGRGAGAGAVGRRRSPAVSTTGSRCCAAGRGTRRSGTARCTRSSTGAGTCSTPDGRRRCGRCPSSPAASPADAAEHVARRGRAAAPGAVWPTSRCSRSTDTPAGARFRMLETVREFSAAQRARGGRGRGGHRPVPRLGAGLRGRAPRLALRPGAVGPPGSGSGPSRTTSCWPCGTASPARTAPPSPPSPPSSRPVVHRVQLPPPGRSGRRTPARCCRTTGPSPNTSKSPAPRRCSARRALFMGYGPRAVRAAGHPAAAAPGPAGHADARRRGRAERGPRDAAARLRVLRRLCDSERAAAGRRRQRASPATSGSTSTTSTARWPRPAGCSPH